MIQGSETVKQFKNELPAFRSNAVCQRTKLALQNSITTTIRAKLPTLSLSINLVALHLNNSNVNEHHNFRIRKDWCD